jgi:hypothetical protein
MECGGMVSSEADQCPHCKTGSYGIQGVKCTVCGGLLKFSEAHRIDRFEENTDFFHNSCYQKVSQIVEKRKQLTVLPARTQTSSVTQLIGVTIFQHFTMVNV